MDLYYEHYLINSSARALSSSIFLSVRLDLIVTEVSIKLIFLYDYIIGFIVLIAEGAHEPFSIIPTVLF